MPDYVTTESELVPVSRLSPHPSNPRQGDVGAVAESITAHGFVGAVVAQRSTSRILVGNHRFQAARSLGLQMVPVIWADVDDERALRIMLADNRTADLAGTSEEALVALLQELEDTGGALAGTGYSEDDLADLLAPREVDPPPGDNGGPGQSQDRSGPPIVSGSRQGAPGLRNVVLVVPEADASTWEGHVERLRSAWSLETPSEVVKLAVQRAAEREGA